MSRNMLKWHSRRRCRLRDTPYAPLVESPDTTNAGNMKQGLKNRALRNIRSSDTSKANLPWRAMVNNADNAKTETKLKSEKNDSEQSSFVTISSEELNLEFSEPDSEKHVKRIAVRRFSDSSISSVAKMSKWCKIRDSLIQARTSFSTLPEVVDKACRKRTSAFVKHAATLSTSDQNPSERMKRARSLRNRRRRWSLFTTKYVKLNNSDSSPSMEFGMEDVAHSTFIHDSKHQQTDKCINGSELKGSETSNQEPVGEKVITDTSLGCVPADPKNDVNGVGKKLDLHKNRRSFSNVKKMAVRTSAGSNMSMERNIQRKKTKRLKGNIGTTRLPKVRRKDSYSVKTLSVKSSEGKVEVKISLELSDARNECRKFSSSSSSRSGVTNKYYLKSPLKKIAITPVLPKRPLSRRSLFSDRTSPRETVTDGETEMASYDKARWNDSSNLSELNATHGAQENSVHLSPYIAETCQAVTPPNSQELTLSIKQVGKYRPRRVRKPRGVRC